MVISGRSVSLNKLFSSKSIVQIKWKKMVIDGDKEKVKISPVIKRLSRINACKVHSCFVYIFCLLNLAL